MSEVTSFSRVSGASPLSTSAEKVPVKNAYCFFNGREWEYYKIGLGKEPEGNFLEISVLPVAIAKTGFIFFSIGRSRVVNEIQVSEKQLFRRKFDVRNRTQLGESSSLSSIVPAATGSGHPTISDPHWVQDSENADLLWSEQERELRDFADTKA